MRVNRRSHERFLLSFIILLSLNFLETNSEGAPKPKEEEYDYKPPGYPGSATNTGISFKYYPFIVVWYNKYKIMKIL